MLADSAIHAPPANAAQTLFRVYAIGDGIHMKCGMLPRFGPSGTGRSADTVVREILPGVVTNQVQKLPGPTFDMLERPCRLGYPACGCAAGPTMTDSGEVVVDFGDIQVACVARGPTSLCMSYVTMRPESAP